MPVATLLAIRAVNAGRDGWWGRKCWTLLAFPDLSCALAPCHRSPLGIMTKKIVKPKGVEPDEIESRVANELYNLEVRRARAVQLIVPTICHIMSRLGKGEA